jgi:F0F1-type ATP synthase gamma subunit
MRADKLSAHRASLSAFGRVARALRVLAVSRRHQAMEALGIAQAHCQALETVVARLGGTAPGADLPDLLPPIQIVLGPEHGFTGAMASALLDHVVARRVADRRADDLVLIGARLTREARMRGMSFTALPLPVHLADGPALAAQLATRCQEAVGRSVELVVMDPAVLIVRSSQLSPVIVAPDLRTCAPLHHLKTDELIRQLTDALLRARLNTHILEAIAAENTARQTRLQRALDGVDDRIAALDRDLRAAHSEAVTVELGDLIGGILASNPQTAHLSA